VGTATVFVARPAVAVNRAALHTKANGSPELAQGFELFLGSMDLERLRANGGSVAVCLNGVRVELARDSDFFMSTADLLVATKAQGFEWLA
jgi:hypothetical protein